MFQTATGLLHPTSVWHSYKDSWTQTGRLQEEREDARAHALNSRTPTDNSSMPYFSSATPYASKPNAIRSRRTGREPCQAGSSPSLQKYVCSVSLVSPSETAAIVKTGIACVGSCAEMEIPLVTPVCFRTIEVNRITRRYASRRRQLRLLLCSCSLRYFAADSIEGLSASRNPNAGTRRVGSSEPRFADRQSAASSFQPPPRITRSEPVAAPGGFELDP